MCRFTIVDNATLTAVQRLKGEIEVKNTYCLDGDILAFESLIQAILFSDQLYFIDDYKEEYRIQRAKSFPFISALSIKKEEYDQLLDGTREKMKNIVPTVKKGNYIDDDFKPFFELLKMNNIFTWDLCSSEFYLSQKMLRDEKNALNINEYNVLRQMIFGETSDMFEKERNPKKIIVNSSGREISYEKNVKKDTKLFLADLSWLAFRTIFYTSIVNKTGGTLLLHPIRNAFQMSYLKKENQGFSETYELLLKTMNLKTEETVKAIYSNTAPIVSKYILPMFSIKLVSESRSIDEALNLALNMREEGSFVNARMQMNEIENLYKEGKQSKGIINANKLVLDVENTMKDLGEKYYTSTAQGIPLSPMIQTYNMGAAISAGTLPTIPDISVKLTSKVKQFIPKIGFNAIYRSLVNDLATVSKIGRYYDELTTNVRYAEEAGSYSALVEESKYRNVACFWKKPMY